MTTTAQLDTGTRPGDDEVRRLAHDVDRHIAYLGEHMTRQTIDDYIRAGAWTTAFLVPLHQAGCDPADLARYQVLGLASVDSAILLAAHGWTPDHLTAADLAPDLLAGYVRCGLEDPRVMRRLNALGVTPAALTNLTAPIRLDPHSRPDLRLTPAQALQLVPALPDIDDLTIDGASGPIRFRIHGGRLSCIDLAAFDDERTWALLGGQASSPATRFFDEWGRRVDADWDSIIDTLGLPASGHPEVLGWIRAIIDAQPTPAEGPAPHATRPPPGALRCVHPSPGPHPPTQRGQRPCLRRHSGHSGGHPNPNQEQP